MSGSFTGFSEEDIKKINSGKPETEVVHKTSRKFIKAKHTSGSNNSNILKSMILSSNNNNPENDTPVNDNPVNSIPDEAKLSTNEEKSINDVPEPVASEIRKSELNTEIDLNDESHVVEIKTNTIEKKYINLDEFQAKQKYYEEQNRRRKELLAKALADRTKQTEEEARRLKEIQNEFKKLDDLLSNDVAILRRQIEVASLDFMEAQKRYHKIEREFLDAKLQLHNKLDKKEMLTEHLCAIIEKNEERKAEKLNELMTRLTIGGNTPTETNTNDDSLPNKEKINGANELCDQEDVANNINE